VVANDGADALRRRHDGCLARRDRSVRHGRLKADALCQQLRGHVRHSRGRSARICADPATRAPLPATSPGDPLDVGGGPDVPDM